MYRRGKCRGWTCWGSDDAKNQSRESVTNTRQRVVACVVSREDRLLVCLRPRHKRHGGLWEFPGGKVEFGESDDQAAARELFEELGIQVTDIGPTVFEIADADSPFVIAFLPVSIAGEPACREHEAILWGTRRELAELPLAPSDRAFLEFINSPGPSSPHGQHVR